MSEASITCRVTKDTLVRFLVLILAFAAIGLYFFYDALKGYPKQNEAFFSYRSFAEAGELAPQFSAEQWSKYCDNKSLLSTVEMQHQLYLTPSEQNPEQLYPLPPKASTYNYPEVLRDHALISTDWYKAWLMYSLERHFDSKPQKAYDTQDILIQKIAGGLCFLLSIIIIFLLQNKRKGALVLEGSQLQIDGCSLNIADITRIDLRQWGVGYKGVAYFYTKDKKLKADGLSFGGFNHKQGQPAQVFMNAVLAQYKGEIIEYAQQES